MITARDLTKIYHIGGTEVRAMDDLSLAIDKGEFLSIMGPSGSGKTTLLNLLGCLDVPTTGQVLIDDADVGSLSASVRTRIRRERIGFVFQEFNLLPSLNAMENVELPLRYMGVKSSERHSRALAALEKVGLKERAKHRPSQISGGEQ
jgi:putative ABC transport system ATP-binding protein